MHSQAPACAALVRCRAVPVASHPLSWGRRLARQQMARFHPILSPASCLLVPSLFRQGVQLTRSVSVPTLPGWVTPASGLALHSRLLPLPRHRRLLYLLLLLPLWPTRQWQRRLLCRP